MRWSSPDGWEVEHIVLDGRRRLRIRHLGFLVAYCDTVWEVEVVLDRYGVALADLDEEPGGPGTTKPPPPSR